MSTKHCITIIHPHYGFEFSAEETWRCAVGFPGYEVSTWGRVKSIPRVVGGRDGKFRRVRGGVLSPWLSSKRPMVALRNCGNRSMSVYVHCLVLRAFVGPRPEGLQCCHYDDMPANNRLENLRWDTAKSNVGDAIRNGKSKRSHPGESNPSSFRSRKEIRKIRELFASRKYTQMQLSVMFDIPQPVVSRIVRGSVWKVAGGPVLAVGRGNGRLRKKS